MTSWINALFWAGVIVFGFSLLVIFWDKSLSRREETIFLKISGVSVVVVFLTGLAHLSGLD